MRRLMSAVILEIYALCLASYQYAQHVRTDEANSLLNIPSPHPPLARGILHTLDGFVFQEFFWRLVFASLLVQAVWLAVRLLPDRKTSVHLAVSACWLLCTGILLQSGSIMMAPLTALQMWVFVYWYLQDDHTKNRAGLIGFFWLLSLFTAYQAVLIAPVVAALLWRQLEPMVRRITYFFLPVALLLVYTLTNPLVPASLLVHGGDSVSINDSLFELMMLWLWSGSIFLSISGLIGSIRARLWPVGMSLCLVLAYVFLARFSYYAILFVPLSMAGLIVLVRARKMSPFIIATGVAVVTAGYVLMFQPLPEPSPARRVMQQLSREQVSGPLLLQGSFGHEWQYESHMPVGRYTESRLTDAGAVICVSACSDLDTNPAWRQVSAEPPFVYVRR